MRVLRYLLDNIYKAIIAFFVAVFMAALIAKRQGFFQHREFNLSIAQIVMPIVVLLLLVTALSWFANRFKKLKIIKATYGVTGKYQDITQALSEFISSDNRLDHRLDNGIVGGEDPAKGVPKHAIIDYQYGWKKKKDSFNEGDRIILPKRKNNRR